MGRLAIFGHTLPESNMRFTPENWMVGIVTGTSFLLGWIRPFFSKGANCEKINSFIQGAFVSLLICWFWRKNPWPGKFLGQTSTIFVNPAACDRWNVPSERWWRRLAWILSIWSTRGGMVGLGKVWAKNWWWFSYRGVIKLSHRIHVWYIIYLSTWMIDFYIVNVNHIPYMNAMG